MASDFGLSPQGFRRKRLSDVISGLNSRISEKLGMRIETNSNSVFGQLIGVFAYEIAALWEQTENVYNAMYPHTAQGVSLTNAAALAGIPLIEAERTTLVATCYGVEGTRIPLNAKISSNSDTDKVYYCTESDIITSGRLVHGELVIDNLTVGTLYSIEIDGVIKSYTAQENDAISTVFTQITTQFEGEFDITNDVLTIKRDKPIKLRTNNITVRLAGSPFYFACSERGAINPAVGTLTNIVNALSGWDSVINDREATVGRNAETDIALRQRWSKSVYTNAVAMVEAIAAGILNIDGVRAAVVYENTSDETDEEGRYPHSVEAIVDGGSDEMIAGEIWKRKPAGIDTFGSVAVPVTDSQGVIHVMNFNRPQEIKIWVKVVISENPEEELPLNAPTEIAKALFDKGQSQAIGEDVILQRYFGAIFNATKGVGYISLTAATGETAGQYSTDNIEISARQIAVFDLSRIEVTIS